MSEETPLGDLLTTLTTKRGGIRYPTPPTLRPALKPAQRLARFLTDLREELLLGPTTAEQAEEIVGEVAHGYGQGMAEHHTH